MFSKSKNARVDTLILAQTNDVGACLERLESYVRAAGVPETPAATLKDLALSISEAESRADASLRRMIDSLDGRFLPATRADLIDIAASCDKIANKCESFADNQVLQHFRLPTEYTPELMEILSVSQEQFALLQKAIGQLFSDMRSLSRDASILDDIRAHESHIDDIEQSLCDRIYDRSEDLAQKMQMAHSLELICDISDTIENIADKLQIMLITRKA